ncbi:MAG UNVERIFIED_CONTAM: hypothetical protein LVT10_26775 [Anaerolineae bacterium]
MASALVSVLRLVGMTVSVSALTTYSLREVNRLAEIALGTNSALADPFLVRQHLRHHRGGGLGHAGVVRCAGVRGRAGAHLLHAGQGRSTTWDQVCCGASIYRANPRYQRWDNNKDILS